MLHNAIAQLDSMSDNFVVPSTTQLSSSIHNMTEHSGSLICFSCGRLAKINTQGEPNVVFPGNTFVVHYYYKTRIGVTNL